VTAGPGARWLGFHLFAPAPFEPLLAGCLAPLMEAGRREGVVRRFFFLRYAEGGMHLRLRVLSGRGVGPDRVRALLEGRLHACLAPGEWRLEEHPYDRAALYFGETAESVHAELLNEATSVLALRLLASPGAGDRTRLWLVLAALLDILARDSTADEAGRRGVLSASRTFARRTAEGLGHPVVAGSWSASAGASLRGARERLATLADDGIVRRTARLLRRCRRCGPRGAFAATHALHLLCNKLGFTVHGEHDIFDALLRLAADADGRAAHSPARSAT
jgi:thiopeptide-type bacteriocin biosynthesis protein